MTFDQTLEAVNAVFCDVLDDPSLRLRPETVADDVEDWDSLTHMQLIVAIEKRFGIKFTLPEVQGLRDVGQLVTAVLAKRG